MQLLIEMMFLSVHHSFDVGSLGYMLGVLDRSNA